MRFYKAILPKEDLIISLDQRNIMKGKHKIHVIYGGLNSDINLSSAAMTIHKIKIQEDNIEFTFKVLSTSNGKILSENLSNVTYQIQKDTDNNFISLNAYLK
ncbi:MAG: hypothetical protein SLAVMIC_00055 [uncultured marine phage]|uniref:Uncharacterized protein n=1 Tax=uncultured marine phage TaxID=707152 RepID=A0A8D9CDF5_9VIRU|nr:MAG: hypothetical protein SLAVMIC_00055 [uncultured marine phage]